MKVQTQKTGLPYEEISFTAANGKELQVFGDRLGTGIRGGMYYMYDDIPLYWDAWDVMDYHLETRRLPEFTAQTPFQRISGNGGIVGVSKFTGSFGKSTIERYTIVRADSPMVEYYTIVDWHEDNKMLKVEFPVDILSREATYGMYPHLFIIQAFSFKKKNK